MRRASFYVGLIVLGTVGPLALASWALLVVDTERAFTDFEDGIGASAEALFAGLEEAHEPLAETIARFDQVADSTGALRATGIMG